MTRIARRTTVLAALLIGTTAVWGAGKAPPPPAPGAKPAAPPPEAAPSAKTLFRFDCAEARVLADAGIADLVKPVVAAVREQHQQAFGDRAVLAELNGDGSPEVFVPVSCGVTCNCTWLVVDKAAHRSLGTVDGCLLHPRTSGAGWATIVTYSELDSKSGAVVTYRMEDGAYAKRSYDVTTWDNAAANALECEYWEKGCR